MAGKSVVRVLQAVMAGEQFQDWVESLKCSLPSAFRTKSELTFWVKKAGFDAILYGERIKTHYGGGQALFWEKRGHTWYAVFSQYADARQLQQFIAAVNRVCGCCMLEEPRQQAAYMVPAVHVLPTRVTEERRLLAVVQEQGLRLQKIGLRLVCPHPLVSLAFEQKRDGAFQVLLLDKGGLSYVFQYVCGLCANEGPPLQEAEDALADYWLLRQAEGVFA